MTCDILRLSAGDHCNRSLRGVSVYKRTRAVFEVHSERRGDILQPEGEERHTGNRAKSIQSGTADSESRRLCEWPEEAGHLWRKLSVSGISQDWRVYEEGLADAHKLRDTLGKMGKLISVLSIFYFPCSIIFLTFPTFPYKK